MGVARSACVLSVLLFCQSCGKGDALGPDPSADTSLLALESIGPGVASAPAQNTNYPKGTVVTYSFTAKDGTSDVYVMLDDVMVPSSGTVVMNQRHGFRAALSTEPGSHAPDFVGQTADGQTVRLSNYRGKVVLADFSETTCPGSINEAPALKSYYNSYHSRGLEIVTVLVNCPGLHNCPTDKVTAPGDLQAWQSFHGLSFPVVSDTGHATQIFNYNEKDRSTGFPSGYIVDAAGIIRYRFVGFDDSVLRAALKSLFP